MGKRIKIVEIIADPNSVTYFNLFAEKSKLHTDIELIFVCMSMQPSDMINDMINRGCDCYWIKFDENKRITDWIIVFFKLFWLFFKIKPDVVHSHLFDDAVPSMLVSKILRIKKRVLTKQCTTFHWFYAKKAVFLDKLTNKWATHIIPVSKESEKFIIEKEKAPKNKIKMIHHGISFDNLVIASDEDINQFKKKYKLENKIVIGTVSRYIKWKGYKYLIKAAVRLTKKYPNIVFIGVGDGPQFDELMELIKEHNLEQKFILTGWIEKKFIPAVFQSLDIYVHCAFMEPFGFVIPEAMVNKLPIVTTPTGSALDALNHLKEAYLIPYYDVEALEDGISYCIENDTSMMVECAYDKVLEMYSIDKMWEKHYELYTS